MVRAEMDARGLRGRDLTEDGPSKAEQGEDSAEEQGGAAGLGDGFVGDGPARAARAFSLRGKSARAGTGLPILAIAPSAISRESRVWLTPKWVSRVDEDFGTGGIAFEEEGAFGDGERGHAEVAAEGEGAGAGLGEGTASDDVAGKEGVGGVASGEAAAREGEAAAGDAGEGA